MRILPIGILVLSLCGAPLAGCRSGDNPPLLFIQSDNYGASVSAGTGTQGVQANVGYRGFNFAAVPVTARDEHGNVVRVDAVNAVETDRDAHSVFGHFSATTNTTQPGVEIGKFFATGLAARRLAEGFRYSIENGTTQ